MAMFEGLYAGADGKNHIAPVRVDDAGRVILAPDGGAITVEVGLVDISGAAIPLGRPVAYINRPDGQPLTATMSDGASSWVYTWTYDASGFVVGESGWVKQ